MGAEFEVTIMIKSLGGIVMVAAAVAGVPVRAQEGDGKAEIVISSFMTDTVTVTYDYVFREYSWNLMTYDLAGQDEVTYRRPANLPGCKQLAEWGIDQGRFTILAGGKQHCTGPLSICDRTNWSIEVHPGGCKSKIQQ
jgi:hypothetical protein